MKKTQKDLVNEFTNLHLQILAIAEELESEEMLRCAIATSEAFFNNLKPKKEWICPDCLGRNGCMCALKPTEETSVNSGVCSKCGEAGDIVGLNIHKCKVK